MTYDHDGFTLKFDINLNDETIYTTEISAKNPPPFCFPIPIILGGIPIPIDLEMCAKLFNIFTSGKNLNMCLDVLAQLFKAPVVVSKIQS